MAHMPDLGISFEEKFAGSSTFALGNRVVFAGTYAEAPSILRR